MEELMKEIELHAPFLTALLRHIDIASGNFHNCPLQWKKLLQSISSSSPVCALFPPSSLNLIQEICEKDIKSQPDVRSPLVTRCLLLIAFTFCRSSSYFMKQYLFFLSYYHLLRAFLGR